MSIQRTTRPPKKSKKGGLGLLRLHIENTVVGDVNAWEISRYVPTQIGSNRRTYYVVGNIMRAGERWDDFRPELGISG